MDHRFQFTGENNIEKIRRDINDLFGMVLGNKGPRRVNYPIERKNIFFVDGKDYIVVSYSKWNRQYKVVVVVTCDENLSFSGMKVLSCQRFDQARKRKREISDTDFNNEINNFINQLGRNR